MEAIKFLTPIARNACEWDELDPQSKGEFLRTLFHSAQLDQDAAQLLLEHIIDTLAESGLLESCEFYEGLNGFLSSRRIVELIFGCYPGDPAENVSKILVDLYSAKLLKADRETWDLIRTNFSSTGFRDMLVRLVEASCDSVRQISGLLDDIFDADEDFEISESVRCILETHWILDILPSKRKAARRILTEMIIAPFPFTKKHVDSFCEEALGLEPIEEEKVAESHSTSSSDSDIESRGSLDDFVVDSDVEDEESSESDDDESLLSSDDESPKTTKKKRKLSSVESVSSNSDYID